MEFKKCLFAYSLLLVIKLKLFQYIIISHNFTTTTNLEEVLN
jgi:hypothetical protein